MTQPAQGTPLLARRIGPVPVWLLILLLVIVGWWWWKRRKSSGDSGSLSVTNTPGGSGVIGSTGSASGVTYPGPWWTTQAQPVPPQPPLPGTTPDPVPDNTPDTPPAATSVTYKVKSGDTLYGIAQKFNLPNWQILYTANAAVIEATAKQHGYSSSSNGHWIFPETVLAIPA